MLTAMAASTMVMKWTSWILSRRKSNMPAPSEVEIDHFFHHHDADRHPDHAANQQKLAGRMSPQKRDVVRRRQVHEDHDDRRQRADDTGGSLGLHRHRLDLFSHLLAVAQHLGKVSE